MNKYNHDKILNHWNSDQTESMYDKFLLDDEIQLIANFIPEGSKILDAGCGEGEGTVIYSEINKATVQGVDFSDTRLLKASERLKNRANVEFKKIDFTQDYELDNDFDIVISQRFIINITDWALQQKIIINLVNHLKEGGRLLLMEGYLQGALALNDFRKEMELSDIPIPWHNLFLDEELLKKLMTDNGLELEHEDGLGSYYLLTRGIRPTLDSNINWDSKFNKMASSRKIKEMLGLGWQFSRVKLWVFKKSSANI